MRYRITTQLATHPTKELSPKSITELKKAITSVKENYGRLSRKYIKKTLNIDIGKRGGIILFRQPEEKAHSIWAVRKNLSTNKAKLLGRGAFGKVKEIENQETGEVRVLKVLVSNQKGDLERFEREGKILEVLKLGSGVVIPKLYNESENSKPGHPCLMMNFASGKTLSTWIQTGDLSPLERIDIYLESLKAVKNIHLKNVTHMDINLGNIMYDAKTQMVSIIDFGGAMIADLGERLNVDTDTYSMCEVGYALFGLDYVLPNGKVIPAVDRKAKDAFDENDSQELKKIVDSLRSKTTSWDDVIHKIEDFRAYWLKKYDIAQEYQMKNNISANFSSRPSHNPEEKEDIPPPPPPDDDIPPPPSDEDVTPQPSKPHVKRKH